MESTEFYMKELIPDYV